MVYYITHTEPLNPQRGNLVRFFIRHFDEKEGRGHSIYQDAPVNLIVPSLEMYVEEAFQELRTLMEVYPHFNFEIKKFSEEKAVIWASIKDRERKKELPGFFLKNKTSPSLLVRFFYPPFTIVDFDSKGNLLLPGINEKREYAPPEIPLMDVKCALDIETTNYKNPDKERITNAVLNFGETKKVIFTTFKNLKGLGKFNDYEIKVVSDTDSIIKNVEETIKKEDPLIIYGFNISFDQEKLRELGEDVDFLPGVDDSKPVFKSVNAIKNMIEKGRWVVDLWGYCFYYKNLYKDNKLETHTNHKKSLSHFELEEKTNFAESTKKGARNTAIEIISYVVRDGEETFSLGEKNIKEIISKSYFTKREPSTICATSGKNIGREFWARKYFFSKNTFIDRFDYGKPEEITFSVEKKQNEILYLRRENGFFENLYLFYPMIFIKAMWPMIRGTTDSLSFETPEEKLNFAQTLNDYINYPLWLYYEALQQKFFGNYPDRLIIKKRKIKPNHFEKEFKQIYGIGMRDIEQRLDNIIYETNKALTLAKVINFSDKFIYVKNPEPLLRQGNKSGLGFVYGSGPTISHKDKIVSLVDNRIIIQGFSIAKYLCPLEKEVIEEALIMRLKEKIDPYFVNAWVEQRLYESAWRKKEELLVPTRCPKTKKIKKIILNSPKDYITHFKKRFGEILAY